MRGIDGAIACLAALLLVLSLLPSREAAAQGAKMVGIVDFYSPTPLGSFAGVIPERFAADALAGLLTRAAEDRFTVVSRAAMGQAEAALHWRAEDVLRFGRLSTLAHVVGADWLVVGWITMLSVKTGGGHRRPFPNGDGGNGPPTGEATVVVKVFDAIQGRIVAERRQWASTIDFIRPRLAERALHEALEPTVPAFIRMLGGQTQ
jgi:hypothetical protein